MNRRLAELRHALNLSQRAFAEKVGLSRNYMWMLENGDRNIPERTIRDICRVYHVSYDWMMTGEGEMFENISDSAIDALIAVYGLDEKDKKIITAFLNLDSKDRQVIKNFVQSMFD